MKLWEGLNQETLKDLADYQWKNYRKKLYLPKGDAKDIVLNTVIEDLEEIDKLMRQPSRRKRAGG